MLNRQPKSPRISFIWVVADKSGQKQDFFVEYPLDNKSVHCYRCLDYLGFLQGKSLQLSRDIYFFCEKCKEKTVNQKGEPTM
jgi:hypothetical protein